MKILIVDDDADKLERIKTLISSTVGEYQHGIDVCGNVAAAAVRLRATKYDLLILDMLVPFREAAEPKPDGGLHLLRSLTKEAAVLLTPDYVIGLTAYTDYASRYEREFASNNWHIVHYDATGSEWEERLVSMLVHIVAARRRTEAGYQYDLAIVTALHRVELESVLQLPADWEVKRVDGDASVYHEGRFQRGGRSLSVIATSSFEMGMAAAAAVATKVIYSFRPRYLIMPGIAAGVKGNFGDVLVASHSWDYGSGKAVGPAPGGSDFEPAPSHLQMDPLASAQLDLFLSKRDQVLPAIVERWRQASAPSPLEVRVGHVASGASVVARRDILDGLVRQNRKLIGVEMEAYSVFVAARAVSNPKPLVLVMKSICDFADEHKNDAYQGYAAFTSAQLVYEFALDQISS